MVRVPGFVIKNFMKIYLHESKHLEFQFFVPRAGNAQIMGAQQGFDNMIIGVDGDPLFDTELYPNDYHLIHNDTFYPNKVKHASDGGAK